jgi:hypothetical protein
MDYVYFDLYDIDPFGFAHAYRMFDEIISAPTTPRFGQIYPR